MKKLTGGTRGLRWWRGRDLNPRPLGYEPNELPDCSTPRQRRPRIIRITRNDVKIRGREGVGSAELALEEVRYGTRDAGFADQTLGNP
jgi:hypothetical protein